MQPTANGAEFWGLLLGGCFPTELHPSLLLPAVFPSREGSHLGEGSENVLRGEFVD